MKFFQETTVWESPHTPNHTYYLSDDKSRMVGYIKQGTSELIKMKRPIRIDTRGRKFNVLPIKGEPDSKYFSPSAPVGAAAADVIVKGSNGKEYRITKNGGSYSCSCPGFGFRRKCKHVQQYLEA